MKNDPIAVARASYDAYVRKDRAALDDFHFTSPLDNRLDRNTYFMRCWPNNQRIKAFDYIRLVADGEVVFVTYEGSNVDGGRFRNTEVLTVRGQQIVEAEVYFGWPIPHKAPEGAFADA